MTTFQFDVIDDSFSITGKIYVDDGNGGAFQGNREITIQRGTQYTFNTQALEENSHTFDGSIYRYLRIGTTTNGGEIDLNYHDGDDNFVITFTPLNSTAPVTNTLYYWVTQTADSTNDRDTAYDYGVIKVEGTINDPPTITLTGASSIQMNQGETYQEPGYNVDDAEDNNDELTVEITGDDFDTKVPGTYTITYTVTDSNEQTASITRTVEVINVAPTITLEGGNITINQGEPFNDPGYNASDVTGDNVNVVITVSGLDSVNDFDTNVPGTYTFTYTATDSYGGTAFVTRNVEVINVAPTITLQGGNITIIEGETFEEPGYTTTDVTGDSVNVVITGDDFDTNTIGTYTITYTATDSYGGTAFVTRNVQVIFNNPPTIDLIGDNPFQMNQGEPFNDPGYNVDDNEDNDEQLTVEITGDDFDTNVPDTYTVTYTVTDNNGKTASKTRNVVVIDLPPTLTLLGANPLNIVEGNEFIEPGYTATDLTDKNLVVNVVGTVDTNTIGTYTLTYTVTDSATNTVTRTRTVNVTEFLTTKMFIGYKIDNITLAALTEDNKNNIIDNIKKLYASQLNVDESKVEVVLSEGSVLANVTISLTGDINSNKSSIESTVVELERNKTRILNVFSEETGINNLLIDSNYENTELFVNDTNSPNLVSAGKPRTQPENLRHLRFLRGKRNSELNNNGKRDIVTSGVGARTASNRGAIARRSLGVTPFVKKFF